MNWKYLIANRLQLVVLHEYKENWGFWFPLMCMEDTGFSYFSIYQQDDRPLLGINPAYNHYLSPEIVATANGNVYCQKLLLEQQIAALNGNPIGVATGEVCLIMPGHSGAGTPEATHDVFVGTAPDNTGILHKKSGHVRKLPVI